MLPLWLINGFVALYGLVGGSFVTAWLWRIKSGESIVKGRSKCPTCHKTLGVFELIPVFSYIAQRGRCKQCNASISPRYPIIELTSSVIFVLVFNQLLLNNDISVTTLVFAVSLFLLVVSSLMLFFYDLFWMILPNIGVTIFAIAAFLFVFIDSIYYENDKNLLFLRLLCMILVFVIFYALYLFKDGKYIGGGDVKLLPLLGLILGFEKFFLMLFLASVAGSVVGLTTLFVKKSSQPFAFGPFLLSSFFILLLYGDLIISYYNSLIFGY